MTCTTTSHYDTHISSECSRFGNGQCDGICSTHEHTECTCSCHHDWDGDLPTTVSGMQDWHDREHGIIERVEGIGAKERAAAAVERLFQEHGDLWDGVRGARFDSWNLTDQPGVHFVGVRFA